MPSVSALLRSANLSDAVRELHALAELRMVGCTQVTALRLSSCHLARLTLHGTRTLQVRSLLLGSSSAVLGSWGPTCTQ